MQADEWAQVAQLSVGGLWDLAVLSERRLIFVVGAQGRSLIDLTTGERVARDRSEHYPDWLHSDAPLARGFGPLGSDWIDIYGLHGGAGRHQTDDGWVAQPGEDGIVLARQASTQLLPAGMVEVRAFAFSEDDQYFVMGTSADLTIVTRSHHGHD